MAENLESIAGLFGFGEKQPDQPPRFAKATAVDDDTVTVKIGSGTAEAVRCAECAVGDIVLLETLPSGQLAAVGTRGTGKDNTSIRVKIRGNTGNASTIWYYPLCSLPANSGGSNGAAFAITGKWGGYQAALARYGAVFVANRGEATAQMAVVDMSPIIAGALSTPYADIVAYEESDNTATIYAAVKGYHASDLRVDMLGGYGIGDATAANSGRFLFDGTYTLTPTGTAGATANTTANKLIIGNSGIKADNITAATLITSPVVQGNTSWYGRNSTAAGTAAKTITCDDFVLVKGALLTVYSTTANTVSGAITLNVNGTGAKTVSVNGSTTTSPQWAAKAVTQYIYTGTYWLLSSNTTP